MPSNTYDLVVLGDDLAALVCATLCARRGMRTLVLGEDRPARYALGPHKLPVEPALWPVGPGSPGERVLIVDDLLATGGTVSATIELVEKLGGHIAGIAFLVELLGLHGRDHLHNYDVFALIKY